MISQTKNWAQNWVEPPKKGLGLAALFAMSGVLNAILSATLNDLTPASKLEPPTFGLQS
jgi:hypothetical protein